MLKVLDEVCTPTMGSKYSAAIDLYAREDAVIGVGKTKIIPLGVCIDLDLIAKCLSLKKEDTLYNECMDSFLKSHFIQLEPRSSLRAKGLQAGTGIVDLDFTQEIKIILHNPLVGLYKEQSETQIKLQYIGANKEADYGIFKISKGDKIAQIMLKEHKTYLMGISTEDKRVGGFGSTGSK